MMTSPSSPLSYDFHRRVDDFQDSVLTLASKLLEYREKEVWLNITGGMNPMTVQALFTAYLGGIIAKIYYTYVPPQYTSLLKPSGRNGTENFHFIEIPMIKVEFDPAYFKVLQIINEKGGTIATEELISRLRSIRLNIDTHGLLKMRGHGVISEDRDGRRTSLTDLGVTLLSFYEDDGFREYVRLVSQPK